jgi:folate-binding protein YgfZ
MRPGVQHQWRQFLAERGFALDAVGGAPVRATQTDADPTASRCVDLGHLTAMRLAGPDAVTFLQGYVTCDMRALSAERALFGAYCNIKGRVVADATIALVAGQPTMVVTASLREPIRTSLTKYLAFARSKFDAPDTAPILLGLVNPSPNDALPREPLTCTPFRDGITIAIPGPQPRALAVLPYEAAVDLWLEHDARGQTGDATMWNLLDVRAGIAHVSATTSEEFLPQMLDYDRIDAISFTKGCYLGQEIVARTQHLGRAKRHLQRLDWRGAPIPPVGAALTTAAGANAGTLVAVAPTGDGRGEALAVLNDKSTGELHTTGVTFAVR